METLTNTTCLQCGKPVPPSTRRHRPRLYCDPHCRWLAGRQAPYDVRPENIRQRYQKVDKGWDAAMAREGLRRR